MRVRVVRTSGRLAARSDAGPIEPRRDVAARPHAAPGMLGLSLDLIVHASRIIWPVERETVADKPLAKVSAINRASCHGAPVLIQRDGCAADRSAGNETVKIVCCLRAASVSKAVFATTKLGAFGSIDAPKPNARAMDLYRVAVDNARLAGEIGGQHGTGCQKQHSDQRYESDEIVNPMFHWSSLKV